MPSWNIHIAHAERLLEKHGASALGICDVDAFHLGNLLPDVYVGYMVKDLTHKTPYEETHYADPSFVPEPRYEHFFELYGAPDADGRVSDLVLGSWAHLVADYHYNHATNVFIHAHGIEPCTETRIKKQGDFALFGRTLDIGTVPHITDEVLRQCASYPAYPLDERDLHLAEQAAADLVRENSVKHLNGTPDYQMLGPDFFSSTFAQVEEHISTGLAAYAAGDPLWGAKRS